MAMVRHSPATQGRPAWSMTPSSTSPPVLDDIVHHTTNLHGAIGEHRRTSRSSSVSSGGSSTNSSDGLDTTRPLSRSRLISVQQSMQDSSLDHGYHHSLLPLNSSQDKKDFSEVKQTHLSTSAAELNLTKEDTGHFNLFVSGHNSGQFQQDIQAYSDLAAAKQGRPIMGTNSSTFSPIGQEQDGSRLFADSFSSILPQGSQQDTLTLPSFFETSSSSDVASSAQYGAGYGYQSFLGDGLFSPGLFSQSPGNKVSSNSSYFTSSFPLTSSQSSSLNGFQSPSVPPGYSSGSSSGFNLTSNVRVGSGFFPSSRQGNDYFSPPASSFQTFSSQDFSLPPPTQPWGSSSMLNNLPESTMKQINCDSCKKVKKWPHILDCLHSFCFPCIVANYNMVDKTISCPNTKCTRKTVAKDGPCSILLDYQGARFMREKGYFPFNCTGCTRDQEAMSCCTTCMAFLCAECKEGHRSINHFQGHNLSPITKIGKCPDGDFKPLCEKHITESLSKYCLTCELIICDKCLMDHLHSDSHQNSHDIKEIYPIVVERLKTWNEDANIKHKDVIEISKKMPMMLQTIENKRRTIKKQIDEYADYCKNVVEQNRIGALEMLDKAHIALDSHLTSWIKQIQTIEQELGAVATFNSRTLEGGSILDLLKLLPTMENEYKKCVANFAETVKDTDGIKVDMKFDPNCLVINDILHEYFSTITYVINDVSHKVPPIVSQTNNYSRVVPRPEYSSAENSDCNYQRWSAAPDSMPISTWNSVSERDRKNGTFIPTLNRYRTKTSYIHMFGEYGRSEYAFTEPSGQAYLKDGSYVICDTNNHRIVYYNNKHEYVRTIGQPPNLPPVPEDGENKNNGLRNKGFTRQDGFLYFPNRVAICPITQNIIATERPPSHDIQIFTIEGEFIRCFGGNILQHPRGVTVDEEGIIIVVECKVMKLTMFNQDGTFIVSHSLTNNLEFPNDVAAKEGKIFISDNRGHCVQVYNYKAEHLYRIGTESITYFPIGVSINYLNQVVVTDNHNTFNITVFDMSGQVLHIFESVSKLAQCHNVAVHPNSLELMLTTKDCSVYFFNYDPNIAHPLTPPAGRPGHVLNSRRGGRGNAISGGVGTGFY